MRVAENRSQGQVREQILSSLDRIGGNDNSISDIVNQENL